MKGNKNLQLTVPVTLVAGREPEITVTDPDDIPTSVLLPGQQEGAVLIDIEINIPTPSATPTGL